MYFDNIADVTESAIIAIANHSCKGVCAYERYMLVSIHGHGIFSKFHQIPPKHEMSPCEKYLPGINHRTPLVGPSWITNNIYYYIINGQGLIRSN